MQHKPTHTAAHRARTHPTAHGMQAGNRPGLLHSLAAVFQDLDLEIKDARIETRHGIAHDAFRVTDRRGVLKDARKLERLPALLSARLGRMHMENHHLAMLSRTADVLVVAVGYPELVRCALAAPRDFDALVLRVPFRCCVLCGRQAQTSQKPQAITAHAHLCVSLFWAFVGPSASRPDAATEFQ
jgi:hypothetical protein